MAKLGKKTIRTMSIFFLLIAFAYGIKFFSIGSFEPDTYWFIAILLRAIIYIGLFATWGVSVRRRVIQPQVRLYLSVISALLIFWIVVRTSKYLIFNNQDLCRYLWYLYYVPQIFIPQMLILIACSLGKPENYRLPKRTNILYVVSATLLGLILTNDMHQLVFRFLKGLTYIESDEYRHGIVYFLTMGWILLCVLSMLIIIYRKCRIPGSEKRIWLPCIPIFVLFAYWVMYMLALPVLNRYCLGDMTVVSSLLCVAMLESCIRCGLIRSNTGYGEMFYCSGIRAIIADDDYQIVMSSADTLPLSEEIMRQTEEAPVLLDGNLRLSSAPIKGGHIMWLEDVSELTALLEELAKKKEDLKEENALLQENYHTELRIRQLSEKNRLYDEIHRQISPQIVRLGELIKQLEASCEETEKKRLLQKMVIIGVYLKRRSNLIFISEQNKMLPVKELSLCFEETMDNVKLSGVSCGCYIAFSHELAADTAMVLYDFAEQVIEATYDTLRSLLIRIFETADSTAISLELSSDADLSGFASEHISVSNDGDEISCLVLRISKGGTKK